MTCIHPSPSWFSHVPPSLPPAAHRRMAAALVWGHQALVGPPREPGAPAVAGFRALSVKDPSVL